MQPWASHIRIPVAGSGCLDYFLQSGPARLQITPPVATPGAESALFDVCCACWLEVWCGMAVASLGISTKLLYVKRS